MKKRISLAVTLMTVIASVGTGWGMGLTGASFELGASARGLGLGGAFTALVDDETAVIHNPAALGRLTGAGFSSLYVRQFSGITYGSVSLAMPGIGLNVSLLDSGAIASPQGSFRYASQAIMISGGVPIGSFGLGVRWRYIRVSSPISGGGWSVDPALMINVGSIHVAAMFESAYSVPISYESGADESFDPSLRLGIAATLSPSPDVWWNAAFETSGLFSARTRFCAGIEAWIGGLGARVGFDGHGPVFGLTIRFSGLQFDWAYATRSDLGNSHRASLAFRF